MTESPLESASSGSRPQADDAPLAANLVGGADNAPRWGGKSAIPGGGYSRFVSLTKVALPFLALGLIALVVAWPRIKGETAFRIGFASINISGETDPGMDNARYVGTDDNRQPFSVTADLARMASDKNDVIVLELPKADMTLEDGTWLVLTADTGRYVQGKSILTLKGGVNLFHDTGYEITTDAIQANLKEGSAAGDKPVNGHGPFGELKGQGIRLYDKGRVIFITGPAQVILYTASQATEGTKP